MTAIRAPMRTVVLHAGMHKTASTYIQRRLRKNLSWLESSLNVITPRIRRDNTELLDATISADFQPWQQWLDQAESKGCQLLVSQEAFSTVLHRSSPQDASCIGHWLQTQLMAAGWNLRLVAFIRDQESYLNSRYTQLVKRLRVDSSFEHYATQAMQGDGISQCNLMTLFGWACPSAGLDSVMIPFGSPFETDGSRLPSRPDPFHQLLATLGSNTLKTDEALTVKARNQQPGRLGVALAIEISTYMKTHHPIHFKTHRKQISAAIELIAEQRKWSKHPFCGPNQELSETIRLNYQHSNATFCNQFWPKANWNTLFPHHQNTTNEQPAELNMDDKALILDLRNQIINATLEGSK